MWRFNLVGPRRIIKEEVETPSPGWKQALIEVKICGICGSDIHSFKGKHPFVHPPIVLGHEFSGIVASKGSGVERINKGDKVTVEPNITCGICHNCRQGRYNICENLKVIGNVGYDGAFAEYIAVPEDKVIKVPDNLSYQEAALIEPTAVTIHAVRESEQGIGDIVVVLGAGTIGLLLMQAAKLAGAEEVVITDLLDHRLQKALDLGADKVINPRKEDFVSFIKKTYGNEGIDTIYDCVGVEETIAQAIQIARKGTKIMVVGVPEKEEIKVNLAYIQDRELELKGSLMYVREDFTTAVELLAKAKIQVDPIVTHHFKFDQIEDAFRLVTEEENKVLKVLVEA